MSGVCHIYDCFGFAGFAPAFSNYANRYTSRGGINAIVASVRRAFTEACAAVQNGLYEIQRGFYLTFASLLVFPSCVIRMLIARDKQAVAHLQRVLNCPKAAFRLCNFVPVVLLSALSPFECLPDQHSPSHYGLFGVALRRVAVAIGLCSG